LLGRSAGFTHVPQIRRAAFHFAVKYSDSCRSYIIRAASQAICWRSLFIKGRGGIRERESCKMAVKRGGRTAPAGK
jgi:hypothetical protein